MASGDSEGKGKERGHEGSKRWAMLPIHTLLKLAGGGREAAWERGKSRGGKRKRGAGRVGGYYEDNEKKLRVSLHYAATRMPPACGWLRLDANAHHPIALLLDYYLIIM